MTVTGYSDRINHALAFAAKHHDQMVRKGVRAPYRTQPANVALILTRYGRDEETVVAGILQDVVEDCVRENGSRDPMVERIAEKFGRTALETILMVCERREDDEGVELAADERRADLLARLATADERARWVCAADELHNAGTLLADLARTEYPETVWSRHADSQEATIRWYRQLHDRLRAVGFTAPIVDELGAMTARLEEYREEE